MLDKGWRVGITADPAALSPGFDDSQWAVRDAKGSMADVPDEDELEGKTAPKATDFNPDSGKQRYAWFRLHIQLAPNHGPLSLLVDLPVSQNTSLGIGTTSPVDVFVNGKLINPEGPHGNAPQHYQQISRLYDLNLAPVDTSLVLVVRTLYVPFGLSSYTSFFSNRTLYLGDRDDLNRVLQIWTARSLFERLPRLVDSILLLVLALFLFALYFAQKGHIEYLWLALHELLQAPIGFVELAGSSAWLDSLWYAAVVLQLVLISSYLYFEFLIAFLALRPEKWWVRWQIRLLRYTAPVLAGVGPTLLLVGHSKAIGVLLLFIMLFCIVWVLGWLLFIFSTLIAATVRRNFEAGLLLIPLVLTGVCRSFLYADKGQVAAFASTPDEAERLARRFSKDYSKPPKPFGGTFHLIEQNKAEIRCQEVSLPPATILSPEAFSLHYGSGGAEWHQVFITKLRSGTHGLSIFEGKAGTGKTFYLRHLMGVLKE